MAGASKHNLYRFFGLDLDNQPSLPMLQLQVSPRSLDDLQAKPKPHNILQKPAENNTNTPVFFLDKDLIFHSCLYFWDSTR